VPRDDVVEVSNYVALRVHEALKAHPLLSLPAICERTGLSFPADSSAVDLLLELGVARELTGKRRNRLFLYDQYLAILYPAPAISA